MIDIIILEDRNLRRSSTDPNNLIISRFAKENRNALTHQNRTRTIISSSKTYRHYGKTGRLTMA